MRGYKTIGQQGYHEEEISRSRFIGQALFVESAEEALLKIEEITQENPKARHVCWAYRLHADQLVEKFSDDGEPAGTAGYPILEGIKRGDYENVLVVVVRYWGGIKLGAGGLARAYAGAATQALGDAQDELHSVWAVLRVVLDYPTYGVVKARVSNSQDMRIAKEEFTDKVCIELELVCGEVENFSNELVNICAGRLELMRLEDRLV